MTGPAQAAPAAAAAVAVKVNHRRIFLDATNKKKFLCEMEPNSPNSLTLEAIQQKKGCSKF